MPQQTQSLQRRDQILCPHRELLKPPKEMMIMARWCLQVQFSVDALVQCLSDKVVPLKGKGCTIQGALHRVLLWCRGKEAQSRNFMFLQGS